VRTSSPSPSDDDSRPKPDNEVRDSGLVRLHLDRDEARRRFERSDVDARGVNFSDSIAVNKRSYKTTTKLVDGETLPRKLARLRWEAEEIQLELDKRKEQPALKDGAEDEEDLEDGVLKLSEILDTLHMKSRSTNGTSRTAEAPLSRQLHEATPSGVNTQVERSQESENSARAEPSQTSTTAAIAAFADRLSSLESALGLGSVPSTNESNSILPTLASLSTQITALSTTLASSTSTSSSYGRSQTSSSIPHLDAVASRLRNLTSESDKLALSRKRALESLHDLQEARIRLPSSFNSAPAQSDPPHGQAASLFEDSSAKIAALYATLPTIQDLQPLLPVVLERLRSLHVLHADAAGAKSDLEEVVNQQAATSQEIERWRKGLEDVEAKMAEYQKVVSGNTEVIGKMVEDIEERLARLEPQ
jgi:nuclear migration protein JNM1